MIASLYSSCHFVLGLQWPNPWPYWIPPIVYGHYRHPTVSALTLPTSDGWLLLCLPWCYQQPLRTLIRVSAGAQGGVFCVDPRIYGTFTNIVLLGINTENSRIVWKQHFCLAHNLSPDLPVCCSFHLQCGQSQSDATASIFANISAWRRVGLAQWSVDIKNFLLT